VADRTPTPQSRPRSADGPPLPRSRPSAADRTPSRGPAEDVYVRRREKIQELFQRLNALDSLHRRLVERAEPILPQFRQPYDILLSGPHRVALSWWHRMGQGDWYFSDYAAHDMDVWTKIHASFLAMGSYLNDTKNFAKNAETRERLSTARGGTAIRLANLNSYRNQLRDILSTSVHLSNQPPLSPEEYDRSLKGLDKEVARSQDAFDDNNITLSQTGRLPDYGTPAHRPPTMGADNSLGNYGWIGVPGENYLKLLEQQHQAAERLEDISSFMAQAIRTVRSSFNDLLSSVEVMLMVFVAFFVIVLQTLITIFVWYIQAQAAAAAAAVTGVPAAAGAAAARLQAILMITTVISTGLTQSASLTNGFVVLFKNESTLGPAATGLLNQVADWQKETSRFPGGRWPNPLKHVGTPEMAVTPGDAFTPGGWQVAYSARDRGFKTALEYERQAPSLDRPWWPEPAELTEPPWQPEQPGSTPPPDRSK
jgi:hypothetical protein